MTMLNLLLLTGQVLLTVTAKYGLGWVGRISSWISRH